MDWVTVSRLLFAGNKPEQFCNKDHCEECFEHNETLVSHTYNTISVDDLGNPGWDPICFTDPIGKNYYMPAFVRLSLETVNKEFYFSQMLFHLEGDGKRNEWYLKCTKEQRAFIANFIEFMMMEYPENLEDNLCVDEATRALDIWRDQA